MTTIRSRKSKGRRLQVEVARKIRETFNLEEADARSTPASVTGEDILLSELARNRFPFSVECKNREHLNIWDAIAQAQKNAGKYVPIVVFSRNHADTYVTIDFDNFLGLIKHGVSGVGND